MSVTGAFGQCLNPGEKSFLGAPVAVKWRPFPMQHPRIAHDLTLPDWGPYTKKYMGVSHVADARRGWRFDLSVIPGLFRRKIDVPNVLWESGHHPWEASPQLEYFSHRHELEWKDRVYCDVAFADGGANARYIACDCVNHSDAPQGLVLHWMASLQFPAVRPWAALLPPGAQWIDALDYRTLDYARFRPGDHLVSDLHLRGEVRGEGFVGGAGVGRDFGAEAGDRVAYNLPSRADGDCVLIRFRAAEGAAVTLQCEGAEEEWVTLHGTGAFAVQALRLRERAAALILTAQGGASVELDGFVLCAPDQISAVRFEPEAREHRPELLPGPDPRSAILRYPGLPHVYGIAWHFERFQLREFLCADLDLFMRHQVHNHVQSVLHGPGEGHFTNAYLGPIPLEPGASAKIEGLVCAGTPEEAAARIAAFHADPGACEAAFRAARAKIAEPAALPSGAPYAFSQRMMRAVTQTNVVYPAAARRAFIKHNTPGRWWDSLYTWDSGFIGLGLLEIDTRRAVDCLAAYVTEPGDPHAAFVHHGSPVPVQHYLFLDLWNKTQSRELLEHFYPRLRQYHHFLSGRDPRSTTLCPRSGLLKTWDYFYNSGGWDDYPPQQHVHAHRLTRSAAPAVTSAHCVRTAKILRMAARELGGLADDIAAYDADIARLSAALQNHAWDEPSGYFGYVRHDHSGCPAGILRHESGENFNRGLDGLSPLLGGICTPEQTARMIAHLRSPQELWTRIGLSTVDQSAAYYRPDGYWNGAVWMPHQWFFWKALLDLGEGDLSWRIADAALNVWKAEVDASYHCFEHFLVQAGRGAGWHQFSGLSTPVLKWYAAYYVPGTLTGGFDVWVAAREFSADYTTLRASLTLHAATASLLVAVMAPGRGYRVLWNGVETAARVLPSGALDIPLPAGPAAGWLEIVPADAA